MLLLAYMWGFSLHEFNIKCDGIMRCSTCVLINVVCVCVRNETQTTLNYVNQYPILSFHHQ